MSPSEIATVALGALGLISTVSVAVFTQVYQGRREDKHARQAARERHAERLLDARLDAYRRLLAGAHRLRELQSGNQPMTPKKHAQIRAAAFEWSRLEAEVVLFAPQKVVDAMRAYDRASATARLGWREWLASEPGSPERAEARERNREPFAAEFAALTALEKAIRQDLAVDEELAAPPGL